MQEKNRGRGGQSSREKERDCVHIYPQTDRHTTQDCYWKAPQEKRGESKHCGGQCSHTLLILEPHVAFLPITYVPKTSLPLCLSLSRARLLHRPLISAPFNHKHLQPLFSSSSSSSSHHTALAQTLTTDRQTERDTASYTSPLTSFIYQERLLLIIIKNKNKIKLAQRRVDRREHGPLL